MGTGSNVLSQQLLPGEQVLDLEVDAVDASSLQQLIPRVFDALGPLRPLRLLLSDGRSWQETSCRELGPLGAAGYPSWGENDELLVDAGDAEVGKQRETHQKKYKNWKMTSKYFEHKLEVLLILSDSLSLAGG